MSRACRRWRATSPTRIVWRPAARTRTRGGCSTRRRPRPSPAQRRRLAVTPTPARPLAWPTPSELPKTAGSDEAWFIAQGRSPAPVRDAGNDARARVGTIARNSHSAAPSRGAVSRADLFSSASSCPCARVASKTSPDADPDRIDITGPNADSHRGGGRRPFTKRRRAESRVGAEVPRRVRALLAAALIADVATRRCRRIRSDPGSGNRRVAGRAGHLRALSFRSSPRMVDAEIVSHGVTIALLAASSRRVHLITAHAAGGCAALFAFERGASTGHARITFVPGQPCAFSCASAAAWWPPYPVRNALLQRSPHDVDCSLCCPERRAPAVRSHWMRPRRRGLVFRRVCPWRRRAPGWLADCGCRAVLL